MSRTLLLAVLCLSVIFVTAQPGTPLNFGTHGIVRTDYGSLTGLPSFPNLGNSVTYGPDGKIYVVSELNGMGYISRWHANGTLDVTYANGGYSDGVKMNLPAGTFQPDGKFVMAGFSNSPGTRFDFALARFLPDGKPDPGFGTGGKVNTAMTNSFLDDWVRYVLVQPDGKILAGGFSDGFGAAGLADFAMARYHSDGSLDNSFGVGGRVITNFAAGRSDFIYSMALQPDGKIIAVGNSALAPGSDLAVARYNPDGSPDASFNGNGRRLIHISTDEIAHSVAVQPDGGIVLGGYTGSGGVNASVVLRLLPDGSTDMSFNGTGISYPPLGAASHQLMSLQLTAGGTITGASLVTTSAENNDLAVFRLAANGTPDNSFNGTGVRIVSNAADESLNSQRCLAIDPDGKPTVIGFEYVGLPATLGRTQVQLLRFNTNGSPDNDFGAMGKATTFMARGNSTNFRGIARQSDGKLVTAGTWNSSTTTTINNDGVVARFLPDGSPDPSFGTAGRVLVTFGAFNEGFNAVAIQPDGKIVVGGTATVAGANSDFALARLLPNGALDPSFGTGGKVLVNFGPAADIANALAIQPDGKIVLAGQANMGAATGNDLALTRLHPDGSPDNSFGTASKYIRALSAGTGPDLCNALSLQSNGMILIGGTYNSGGTKGFVMRLTAGGVPDLNFAGTGWKAMGLGSTNEGLTGLLVQPDGKIVAGTHTVGNAQAGQIAQMALVRLNANGDFDNDFNGNGKRFISIPGQPTLSGAIEQQADGKLLLIGRASGVFLAADLVVARIRTNGAMDASFGGGVIPFPTTDGDETPHAAVVHNNEVYIAGFGSHPGSIGVLAGLSLGQLEVASSLVVQPASQQYSDAVTLTAQVHPATLAGQQPASEVRFSIGSRVLGSAPLQPNGSSLEASITVPLSELDHTGSVAPGVHAVTAVFTAPALFQVAPATASLTITAEDAGLTYSGATFVSTPNVPNNQSITVPVPLRATVTDAADGKPGDIRRARVRFLLVNNGTSTPIVSPATDGQGWMPVQLLHPVDSSVGTASLLWPVTLGANELSNSFTIAMEVGGPQSYYVRQNVNDQSVITVSRADMDFITGGGTLQSSNSTGSWAPTSGTVINFGFHAKYNRSGKNTQGKANIIFRRMVGSSLRVYQIKANRMQSLGVELSNPAAAQGQFTAKANLFDITNPDLPVQLVNNGQLEVRVTDRGEPGLEDAVSIVLYAPDGTIAMASSWTGMQAAQQTISGGNIRVSGGTSAITRRPAVIGSEEQALRVVVNNPSSTSFQIRLAGGTGESVAVDVRNGAGQVVERFGGLKAGTVLPIGAHYPAGTYLLRVQQGRSVSVIRLVKQ